MLTATKNYTARILRAIARRLDPSHADRPAISPCLQSLKVLKSLSYSPAHIVDIGANHGYWTNQALKIFPDAHFSLLEPNPQLKQPLAELLINPRVALHQVGAGAEDGELTFHIHPDDTSSSFSFTTDEADSMGCKPITVPIRRLDSLLAEVPLPPPNIVKIDAEGLDLEVLRGAAKTIALSDIVYIECTVICKSMANDMITVLLAMRDLGFELFDISDTVRTPTHKSLWLMEMVFIRSDSDLCKRSREYK